MSAYPGGIWFVALAGLSEPELVQGAVARAVGGRSRAGARLPLPIRRLDDRTTGGGNYGLNIFAAGYPASKKIDCSTGLPLDDVEATSVSKSGLTYDTASGLYTYVWKTDKTWKGTCRELNLKLADGTNHPVQFRFT